METRGNFGSKLGVILATAGSAVGLGNVWRFPYMAGQNGGAAFILIYLVCIILLGLPGMMSEFIIGRHSASNAARAYSNLGKHKAWGALGLMGVITSMIILGFYAVVAGWCLQYLYASIMGGVHGDAEYVKTYFQTFAADPIRPTLWAVGFILLTHMVVVRGVRNGIEKASKILMPMLFFLLIVIVIASCSLPGAMKGVEFLLKPDFSKVDENVLLEALGQAFFSLSMGTACLCTYASYFNRQTNLLKSATQIVTIDTVIAVLAGLMIFPAAFSVGVQPDSGPSLIFITLPNVFQEAFGNMPVVGYVISVLFYALLVLAALTSTISMHEIGTAFIYEEGRISRAKGAWFETIVCCIIAVFCSLSQGAVPDLGFFGKDFLSNCDNFTAQLLMPLSSFITCLFLGWYVPKKIVRDEFTNWGTLKGTLFPVFLFTNLYERNILTGLKKNLVSKYTPFHSGLFVSCICLLAGLSVNYGIPAPYWLLSIFIWIGILLIIQRIMPVMEVTNPVSQIGICILCILICLPTMFAPYLSGSLLLILICFHYGYKAECAAALLLFIYAVSKYYYDLNLSLLVKSITLFFTGIIFMIAWYYFTQKRTKHEKTESDTDYH